MIRMKQVRNKHGQRGTHPHISRTYNKGSWSEAGRSKSLKGGELVAGCRQFPRDPVLHPVLPRLSKRSVQARHSPQTQTLRQQAGISSQKSIGSGKQLQHHSAYLQSIV